MKPPAVPAVRRVSILTRKPSRNLPSTGRYSIYRYHTNLCRARTNFVVRVLNGLGRLKNLRGCAKRIDCETGFYDDVIISWTERGQEPFRSWFWVCLISRDVTQQLSAVVSRIGSLVAIEIGCPIDRGSESRNPCLELCTETKGNEKGQWRREKASFCWRLSHWSVPSLQRRPDFLGRQPQDPLLLVRWIPPLPSDPDLY